MPRHLLNWVITSLAVFMVPHLVSGIHVEGFSSALMVAAVLGFFNVLIRPLLVLVTLPLTILSFGFFLLFLNAFLFRLAGSFVSGFQVETFSAAFYASLVVSFIGWILGTSSKKRQRRIVWKMHNGERKRDMSVRDLN